MKLVSLAGLAVLIFTTSLVDTADAGRRRRRRAAVAAGVVAATSRRATVVAVAPVRRVAGATVVAQSYHVIRSPDLTIAEIAAKGNVHCITVKNLGQAAAPTSTLKLDFRRSSDQALVTMKKIQVPPLLVQQSIRFRLHTLPQGPVHLIAEVDSDHQVAESNEENNDMTLEIAGPPSAPEPAPLEPAPLKDVDVWVAPDVPAASQ